MLEFGLILKLGPFEFLEACVRMIARQQCVLVKLLAEEANRKAFQKVLLLYNLACF